MTLHRQFVVRMDLNGEILTGVDELHQQRELVAILLIDLLTNKQALILVNKFGECQTYIDIIYQTALDGMAFITWYTTDFPTLTNVGLCGKNALEGRNLIASPQGRLQKRFKLIWFHLL